MWMKQISTFWTIDYHIISCHVPYLVILQTAVRVICLVEPWKHDFNGRTTWKARHYNCVGLVAMLKLLPMLFFISFWFS